MSEKTENETKFFDLHTTGIGYLNRARLVRPKKNGRRFTPFLAVDVVAIHGRADDPVKTRFDTKVTGTEAQRVIRELMGSINDRERKVVAAFTLGDLVPEIFQYENGEKAGQCAVSLKCRLLRLAWVKVDGKFVYRPETQEQASEQEEQAEPETTSGDDGNQDDGNQPVESDKKPATGFFHDEPEIVRLKKDEPRFQDKKSELGESFREAS